MGRRSASAPRVPAGIRPTSRGVGMVCLALFAYGAALILGSAELFALASASAVLVVSSALALALLPPGVECERVVAGGHATAGDNVRILYTLSVQRATMFPVRRVLETLQRGDRTPETLLLSGVVANDTTSVAFDALPRGTYRLGPVRVVRRDPLGLFWRVGSGGGTSPLRVWPRAVAMRSALAAAAADGTAAASATIPRQGDEFKQLREFGRGDDRRMVHWKASAKRAKLLVRETESDALASVTILLDCRMLAYLAPAASGAPSGPVTDGDVVGFEDAVSAVASLVGAFAAEGWRIRLGTIGGPLAQPMPVSEPAAVPPAMELLAEVTATGGGPDALAAALSAVRREADGTLVVVSGVPDPAVPAAVSQFGRGFTDRTVVWCDAVRGGVADRVPSASGIRSLVPPTVHDLPAAWYSASRSARGVAQR